MYTTDSKFIETVITKVNAVLGSSIIAYEMVGDMPQFTVEKTCIPQLFQLMHDDKNLNFMFLTDLCGIHYPDSDKPFGVVYHLHNLIKNQRVRVKTFTSGAIPTVPTATTVYSAANWMERETFDFYGIHFEGHPNLKRILNVDDMSYHPLRKEYPLEDATREDKNDAMFGR